MLWRFFIILVLLANFSFAKADSEIYLSSFCPSDPIIEGDWDRLVLPLKRNGNLLLLQGQIDSIQGDFIVDTGAPYLILNSSYFRHYASRQNIQASGVNSGVMNAQRGFVNRLELGDLSYSQVDCDIVELSQLENKLGSKLLGLLGTHLFSSFKIYIDVRSSQLIIYRKNKKDEFFFSPEMDTLILGSTLQNPAIQLPFKWCDNKIFMPVEVGGVKMNWMLDTGAESNVIDAMVKKKALKEFNVQRRVALTGTGGAKQEVFLGTLNELSVGQQTFAMQSTILTGMVELNETCSVFVDGILGYSFYSQGVFSVDFITKEFCLYLYEKNE